MAKSHPVMERTGSSPTVPPSEPADLNKFARGQGWAEWTPAKLRKRRDSISPLVGRAEDDESESDSGPDAERVRQDARKLDRELAIMRRYFRKWCRKAGVSNGTTCEDLPEEECDVNWTKPIAPQVEGRIQMMSAGST